MYHTGVLPGKLSTFQTIHRASNTAATQQRKKGKQHQTECSGSTWNTASNTAATQLRKKGTQHQTECRGSASNSASNTAANAAVAHRTQQ